MKETELKPRMNGFSPIKFVELLIKKSIEGTEREGCKFTLIEMPEEASKEKLA